MAGSKLAELRKAVGLSQTEAADRLQISRMELYRIESGKKDLPLSLVFRMLHVYQVLHKLCINDLMEIYPGSFSRFASWSRTDYMRRHPKPIVHGTPQVGGTIKGAQNHTNKKSVSHDPKTVHDDEDEMPP